MSLLLCIAAAVIWVLSYQLTQYVGWSDQRQFYGALSIAGLLRVEHGTYPGRPGFSYEQRNEINETLWNEAAARDRRGGVFKQLGFAYSYIDYYSNGKEVRQSIYLPHWSLVAFFGLLSLFKLIALLRRRPHGPGLCAACGYDMRATPDRCPECGGVPASLRQIEQH